ncbi:unnamed protein product [Phytomonas sp. Hart1]|nr:unnamed protein product [Phytomonas sp. Hart1]|eukprot:CCW69779.1 unnamed protein product [Phytomonas sp. isolate Hart1]
MNTPIVIVGDSILGGRNSCKLQTSSDELYLRGFNTVSGNNPTDSARTSQGAGEIIAAVSGCVEVIEKVVSVKGRQPRYLAEIGDVVIGRITEISGNKWLVDLNSTHDGIMLLSNVAEPGGILRRRGRSDELSMHQLFDQNDLVVAEVQRISPDGVIFLHTRAAEKYGKLTSLGHLVSVPPFFIRRAKHQFLELPDYNTQLIVGMNGNIWVSQMTKNANNKSLEDHSQDDVDVRLNVARVANCVKVLGISGIKIYFKSVESIVNRSKAIGFSPYDILLLKNREALISEVYDIIGTKRLRT